MTTPDQPAGKPKAAPDGAAERVKRPIPPRTGPQRGASLHPGFIDKDGHRGGGGPQKLTEDVAEAVRVGYEVFTNNLEIGRRAASEFSQGQYNFRQVPQDAGLAIHEIIRLLRELSEKTFDICDRLALQLANPTTPRPNPPQPAPVPPFRSERTGAASPNPDAQPQTLAVSVRFVAPIQGTALVSSLDRPRAATSLAQIKVSPLLPREATGAPITDVTLDYDVASDGLAATVTAPAGQAPGVYSGVVWAETQDAPLGVLAVEISA